jgi:hypothetical protein
VPNNSASAQRPCEAHPRIQANGIGWLLHANVSSSGRLYALWSPASSFYGWEYGMHTREQFEALRDSFAASSSWKIAYSSGGTVLFEYTGA